MIGVVSCVSFYVINENETIFPRRTNDDTVENHFCYSRQFGGSGTNPTSQQQKTNYFRASVHQVAKSHAREPIFLYSITRRNISSIYSYEEED